MNVASLRAIIQYVLQCRNMFIYVALWHDTLNKYKTCGISLDME